MDDKMEVYEGLGGWRVKFGDMEYMDIDGMEPGKTALNAVSMVGDLALEAEESVAWNNLWEELTQNHKMLSEVITSQEISQIYGVDGSTVRRACIEGWIMARKAGGVWLIRRTDAKARWGDNAPAFKKEVE